MTATLVDPNGQSTQIDSGSKQPGTYTFNFSSFATEGTWHWNVQATDAQNRASNATPAVHLRPDALRRIRSEVARQRR